MRQIKRVKRALSDAERFKLRKLRGKIEVEKDDIIAEGRSRRAFSRKLPRQGAQKSRSEKPDQRETCRGKGQHHENRRERKNGTIQG